MSDTQKCTMCGKDKALTEFRMEHRWNRRRRDCKECFAAYMRRWYKMNRLKKEKKKST